MATCDWTHSNRRSPTVPTPSCGRMFSTSSISATCLPRMRSSNQRMKTSPTPLEGAGRIEGGTQRSGKNFFVPLLRNYLANLHRESGVLIYQASMGPLSGGIQGEGDFRAEFIVRPRVAAEEGGGDSRNSTNRAVCALHRSAQGDEGFGRHPPVRQLPGGGLF